MMRATKNKQVLSELLADAAAAESRTCGLVRVVADWEAEHGEISDEELADVDREIDRARLRSWTPKRLGR